VKVLLGGILQAFAGMDVQDYQAAAHGFLHQGQHPTLGRRFAECGYLPMIELLRYLEASGFTSYIASGGDRDFMRPVTQAIYGIPSEHVIGSSNALRYEPDEQGGSIVYLAEPDVFDDGPVKAERSLEQATAQGWTVVSIRRDWATVFGDPADDDQR
jgi:hypothetical protein